MLTAGQLKVREAGDCESGWMATKMAATQRIEQQPFFLLANQLVGGTEGWRYFACIIFFVAASVAVSKV